MTIMLQKWKSILTNWINCYFIESDVKEPCITLDVLLSIISHLRENLSLDESKSSLLEAHTVEEFIHEKFPVFVFTNGTVEATSEGELYMVASLLLFFVCVNSKDIDIKSAMCNKLSTEDQEVILKFSKCLMECSAITYKDVQRAITDACSADSMIAESSNACPMVSETPPALRTLHGEVRRLQAALEAERFDRNYLQEELTRTNLRVEKLSKDKEQYKQDIVNLKAKISMCCGQESEGNLGDKATEGTTKLLKELQETEERLVKTQGQLDEALYERDTYKAKVNELKQERDKWLELSQQESARVVQLSEELTVERRHVQSLKELMEELRQHQQLNRLDSSLLECDDPDVSVISLPHNSSFCSDVCANVVEVQLSEERARTVLLKQQIQSLQEQLTTLTQKSETEILTLNTILSERDNVILNLKHRINEEIETKNKLVIQYSDENSRLNNEINELEQKLQDNKHQHRILLESKMQDIQTLQEEKLSLLQSLNNETTKLEDLIKNLKSELITEKDAKLLLKEDYSNQIMKLNEKVLNRNNELVELQNNVFEKSEQIETLHLELRKEKQGKEDVLKIYHNELELFNAKRTEAENLIQQKNEEIKNLMDRLNHNYNFTEELNRDIILLKEKNTQVISDYMVAEEAKNSLVQEIGIRDDKIDELCKESENLKNLLSEERSTHKNHKDDYETKIGALTATIEETRHDMLRCKDSFTAVLESKARDIQTLKQENESLVDELNDVKHQLKLKVHSLTEKLTDNENLTEKLKNTYECQIENLNVMITKLTNYLKDKTSELDIIKKENQQLQEIIECNNGVIKTLEEGVKLQKSISEKLINDFESERLVLKNMVTVTESVMEDQKLSLNETISNNVKEIEALKEELQDLHYKYATETAAADVKLHENKEMFEAVIKDLSEERVAKEKLQKELENQIIHFTIEINKVKEEMTAKSTEKEMLETQHKELTAVMQKYSDEFAIVQKEKNELANEMKLVMEQMQSASHKLSDLEMRCKSLEHESQISRKVITQLKDENKVLNNKVNDLKKDNDTKLSEIEIVENSKSKVESLLQLNKKELVIANETIEQLKVDKESLQNDIINQTNELSKWLQEHEEIVNKLHIQIHEKDSQNNDLANNILLLTTKLESVTKTNEELTVETSDDKIKIKELETKLANKTKLEAKIAEIDNENSKLLKTINENKLVISKLQDELKSEKQQQEKILLVCETEKQTLNKKLEELQSVIQIQKDNQNKILSNYAEESAELKEQYRVLENKLETAKVKSDKEMREKDIKIEDMIKEIMDMRTENNKLATEIETLKIEMECKSSQIDLLESQKEALNSALQQLKKDIALLEESNNEIKLRKDSEEPELLNKIDNISKELMEQQTVNKRLERDIEERENQAIILRDQIEIVVNEKTSMQEQLNEYKGKMDEAELNKVKLNSQIDELKSNNEKLVAVIEESKTVITSLEKEIENLKHIQAKYVTDFELEREQLKRIISLSESDLDNKFAVLNNELETLKMDKRLLEQQLSEYETKIEEAELNKLTLYKQIDMLKHENKQSETINEDNKTVITTLQNEIITLQKQQDKLVSDFDLERAEFRKFRSVSESDSEKRVTILINELEKVVKDRTNVENKLSECESKVESVTVELNKQIDKLKDENKNNVIVIEENKRVITSLENEIHALKQMQAEYVSDFDIERKELKKIISDSELIIEEHQVNLDKIQSKHIKTNAENKEALQKLQERETALEAKIRKLYEVINEKENLHKIMTIEKESLVQETDALKQEVTTIATQVDTLKREYNKLEDLLKQNKNDLVSMEKHNNELKIVIDSQETEYNGKLNKLSIEYDDQIKANKDLESALDEKRKLTVELEEKLTALNNQVEVLTKAYNSLEHEKDEYKFRVDQMKARAAEEDGTLIEELSKLKRENIDLFNLVEENKKVILNLEEALKKEKESNDYVKLILTNKSSILQEYQIKADKQLEEQQKEIIMLQKELEVFKCKVDIYEKDFNEKEECIKSKDEKISSMQQQLLEEKANLVKIQNDLDTNTAVVSELKQRLNDAHSEDMLKVLSNEEWVRAMAQRDTYAVATLEKTGSHKYTSPFEKDYREYHHQVDNTTSDLTHSSMDSIKTISDLEKIIHDKNKTITTLQSDIAYMKTLVADSENKFLDITRELEICKENCQQLANQLKKIVYQKNEEIAELKKHVNKMSVTENRASQIIKVSAKYQAIILKRISEIKSNAVLKELTNFGNGATNGDSELRRSLNAGTITMEDLENFLETTDKHLRRCSEKQIMLQKERDRLTEVNRINESEIINLKKFLTELSVSFKTFSNVKELYTQKFSRVVSMQRMVRREILSLDDRIDDATMCKLERGYAATMQDLAECIMNLERWVERSISRTISAEKIKQAFSSDENRASLASTTFQNTSLEVQLDELENSFQKLLEEVVRAQKGEGAKNTQSLTVLELHAEYEEKLNRMKAKMKELYAEQIMKVKNSQSNEIALLKRELLETRQRLTESSKDYEQHIRSLTTELWRVGEKFLTKKDELDWERKKQRSGSLMSLQHVHSSGLVPLKEDHSRISDAHSLRSLPIHNNTNKRETRPLHVSDEDEEGELFDNRCLAELAATPRPERLAELRWRNSLCPPHLKSCYPAETQLAPAAHEDHIKCMDAASMGGRNQRKEVGITAYKKPGPPTPSKQAGRLSATDSELRESLRPEPEPHVSRKTSTPSRLRLLFRSNKNDTAEGTPRRRLSMFRKK